MGMLLAQDVLPAGVIPVPRDLLPQDFPNPPSGFTYPPDPEPAAAPGGPPIFVAACGEDVSTFSLVRASGPNAVERAEADSPRPIAGIVLEKPSATTARVQAIGYVQWGGLAAGANYYLGAAGSCYAGPFSTAYAYVHRIGMALTPSCLFLQPTRTPIRLSEL